MLFAIVVHRVLYEANNKRPVEKKEKGKKLRTYQTNIIQFSHTGLRMSVDEVDYVNMWLSVSECAAQSESLVSVVQKPTTGKVKRLKDSWW